MLSEALIQRRILSGDLGQPDDIAASAAFLASPDARFITGQTIVVDGGLAIQGGIDPPSRSPTDPGSLHMSATLRRPLAVGQPSWPAAPWIMTRHGPDRLVRPPARTGRRA